LYFDTSMEDLMNDLYILNLPEMTSYF
jgi:hypothetical protein